MLAWVYQSITTLKETIAKYGKTSASNNIDYHDPRKLQAPRK
jgi:hypothetical protein